MYVVHIHSTYSIQQHTEYNFTQEKKKKVKNVIFFMIDLNVYYIYAVCRYVCSNGLHC